MFLDNLYNSLIENKNNNAFCIKDKFYTFTQFAHKIALIQNELETRKDYFDNNKRVAILCSDDISTYAAVVGIWFLGFSYVPLGLHNPAERNLAILRDAEIKVILTCIPLDANLYKGYDVINILDIKDERAVIKKTSCNENQLAYILFTSGSTGRPKGVSITLNNLDTFIEAFEKSAVKINSSDRCLQMFELTFDVSISSFLPALIKGACVYTIPNDVIKYVQVLKVISKYELTIIQIVPSIIRLSASLLPKLNLHSVKYCILTGEATSIDLLNLFKPVISNAKIFNYYGPTECTIYCSYYDCNSESIIHYNGMIGIGKPFDGILFVIVDENNQEIGTGMKGELLISGSQVTKGYLNDPARNQITFISIKKNDRENIYYRSGDLCFRDENDDIHYCGRLDNQVKIQGYRIELNEIEQVVRDMMGINSVAIAVNNKVGVLQLVLILEIEKPIEKSLVFNKLQARLPDYMIPVDLYCLPQFPLNSSGKTDRPQIKRIVSV